MSACLCASASCVPKPVGHTNRCQIFLYLVFPMDTRSSPSSTSLDPRIKYPSHRILLLHTYDMADPAQPLDINSLHNVHVVKGLIQLIIISDAEIIANSHYTEELFSRILSRQWHRCLIGSLPLRHKEARVG